MSETTVHQLLNDVERTIHERLEAIRMFISRPPAPTESTMVAQLISRIDSLEKEVVKLRETPSCCESNSLIMPHPLKGLEVLPKKEIEVVTSKEIVLETPDRINEADRLLLNSSARKALQEEEDAVYEEEALAQDEVFDELEEEEQPAEEEQEEEVEAEEQPVEEEQEEEVEAEEAEEEELEEFEYRGATYYRDTEKNVYMTNEDGGFENIGVWSDVKNRIIVKKPQA